MTEHEKEMAAEIAAVKEALYPTTDWVMSEQMENDDWVIWKKIVERTRAALPLHAKAGGPPK